MRNFSILLALAASILIPQCALSQSGNAKQAIDLIVLMCVAGGEKVEIAGNVEVDGGFALRRLGISGGGELKISSTESKGLVEGLATSMNKISADQASEARRCMQPFIAQVLAMLPKGEVVAPVNSPNCPDNNSYQCAAQLGFGERESGEFARSSKFYKFEVTEPSTVKVILNPMPNSRFVVVKIQAQDYSKVGSKRFNAGQPDSYQVSLRAPGTYYLELDPGSCCSGAPYTYTVSLTR